MRRPRLLLLAVAILAFLVISVLLARAFNADGNEHSAITAVINAEAAGDAARLNAAIDGCHAGSACAARNTTLAAGLHRSGQVKILQLGSSTGFSLAGSTGTSRVAWDTTESRQPIVQCVRVHRSGNVLTGISIHLVRLSVRIRSDADCPSRF